jgi:serine/threonine-protein kinase
MSPCPRCSAPIPDGSRFCPSCGNALAPDDATETSVGSAPTVASSSSEPSGGRFIPGTVLADRYRVIGLLGRGGMGEVYRAEDLKLGQSVALKWLPRSVEKDPARLRRFMSEVRLSLKVTHPNVCRVFDIGEVGDAHFLSMEYVDGEDLASLLRRIDRLPGDKAVQVARQLCAGLAAAHDEGVLHRDLKPANVMLDGRGRAKITDFGLAGATEGIEGVEARAGTPGYMAPEQLSGGKLTQRTDIYALGLVLYELFTGKRAFEAGSVADMQRLQSETTPSTPSSHVEGIDPLVESVILRCLATDPADRPESAQAVAAALPGGDPLAAALAAGETPSPDMVAAAGGRGGLATPIAWSLLALAFAGITAAVLLAAPQNLLNRMHPEKSIPVLEDKARELLDDLDLRDPEAAEYAWMISEAAAVEWARDRIGEPDWYAGVPEDLPWVRFWYRQRDGVLTSRHSYGYTLPDDPPLIVPGEILVELDLRGRLLWLEVVPQGALPESTAPCDWTPLFAAAEIDPAKLTPTRPRQTPPHFADNTQAWEGPSAREGDFGEPLRVEAASLGDRPVFFRVEKPWDEPAAAGGARLFPILVAIAMIVAAILARRNLRTGRADLRGANVLLAIYVALHTVTILPVLALSPDPGALAGQVTQMLSRAGFQGAFVWLAYLGLGPVVRRRWPSVLVAWSRMLQGGLLDPLVGRHVLIGCAAGALMGVIGHLPFWIAALTERSLPLPLDSTNIPTFGNGFSAFLWLLHMSLHFVEFSMVLLLIFVVLSMVLRKTWLAAVAYLALGVLAGIAGETGAIELALTTLLFAIWLLLILRVGYLAAAVAACVAAWTGTSGISTAFGEWYGKPTVVWLAVFVAFAGYAFWVSLAGRPMFGGAVEE